MSLVAVDQVNHTLPGTAIHSSLASTEGGLGEGQMIQKTKDSCTNLTFSVFSIRDINYAITCNMHFCGYSFDS